MVSEESVESSVCAFSRTDCQGYSVSQVAEGLAGEEGGPKDDTNELVDNSLGTSLVAEKSQDYDEEHKSATNSDDQFGEDDSSSVMSIPTPILPVEMPDLRDRTSALFPFLFPAQSMRKDLLLKVWCRRIPRKNQRSELETRKYAL
jgi:hypothetical protein